MIAENQVMCKYFGMQVVVSFLGSESGAIKNAQQSVHPTLGIRRHFQAFSHASAFFQSDGVPPPAQRG